LVVEEKLEVAARVTRKTQVLIILATRTTGILTEEIDSHIRLQRVKPIINRGLRLNLKRIRDYVISRVPELGEHDLDHTRVASLVSDCIFNCDSSEFPIFNTGEFRGVNTCQASAIDLLFAELDLLWQRDSYTHVLLVIDWPESHCVVCHDILLKVGRDYRGVVSVEGSWDGVLDIEVLQIARLLNHETILGVDSILDGVIGWLKGHWVLDVSQLD
jgi:hypothetical protein